MKRYIFLFIALLVWTECTRAQIFILPRGGVNLSNFSFSDEIKRDLGLNPRNNLGFSFGMSVNIPVAGPFSIQPELFYTQKGFKISFEEFDSNYEYTETSRLFLNYIELPILGSLQFGDENVQAIINLGPYIGYGVGGKAKFEEDYKDIEFPEESYNETFDSFVKFGQRPVEEMSSDVYIDNAFDYGFQFGLGVGVSAGPGFIVFEQRYRYGLGDLFKEGGNQSYVDVKSQNRGFMATLGYTINLGGGGGERTFKKKFRRR